MRDGVEPMTSPAWCQRRAWHRTVLAIRGGERREKLRRAPFVVIERHAEIRRHHADDQLRFARNLDAPADRRGITAEMTLPERVADQCHFVCARYVLLRQ